MAPPKASISLTICPLARPPIAGIARHLGHRIQVLGQQEGGTAKPRRSQRRFNARVAASDHDYIVFLWIVFICSTWN